MRQPVTSQISAVSQPACPPCWPARPWWRWSKITLDDSGPSRYLYFLWFNHQAQIPA